MDRKKIVDQLHGLQRVLESACQLVEDMDETSPQLRAMRKLLDGTEDLYRCRTEMAGLKAKLEPQRRRLQLTQVLIWPLKEGDVRKTLEYLAHFERSLILAMNVDQTYISFAKH